MCTWTTRLWASVATIGKSAHALLVQSQLHLANIILFCPPSWFPVVYPEYLVKPTVDYNYGIWLVPIKKGDDAAVSARNIKEHIFLESTRGV
jgi:hypothetical protein